MSLNNPTTAYQIFWDSHAKLYQIVWSEQRQWKNKQFDQRQDAINFIADHLYKEQKMPLPTDGLSGYDYAISLLQKIVDESSGEPTVYIQGMEWAIEYLKAHRPVEN